MSTWLTFRRLTSGLEMHERRRRPANNSDVSRLTGVRMVEPCFDWGWLTKGKKKKESKHGQVLVDAAGLIPMQGCTDQATLSLVVPPAAAGSAER